MDPSAPGSNSGLLPPPSPRQHSAPTFSEEVKAALAAFAQVDPATPHTAVPPALMRVVPDIAQTGLTWYLPATFGKHADVSSYDWVQLKVLIMFQLDQVCLFASSARASLNLHRDYRNSTNCIPISNRSSTSTADASSLA